MGNDRVAVYVSADVSLPEVLRIASGLGARITSADVSRTSSHRVINVDIDVAHLLSDIDTRLRFVPDITAKPDRSGPAAQLMTAPKPVAHRPMGSEPVKTDMPGDEESKPKKKTKAKKTTARRKTRGANGGES